MPTACRRRRRLVESPRRLRRRPGRGGRNELKRVAGWVGTLLETDLDRDQYQLHALAETIACIVELDRADEKGARPPSSQGCRAGQQDHDDRGIRCRPAGAIFVVPKMQDTFTAQPMLRAAQPVELSATNPSQIRATDADELFDDPMGVALVSLDQVQKGGAIDSEFRLGGLPSGSVRILAERLDAH